MLTPTPTWHYLNTVHSFDVWNGSGNALENITLTNSGISANNVMLAPFLVREPIVARKMSYIVGTTPTGNVNMGIYNSAGALVVASSSVAQGTASTIQTLDITDTLLTPGLYLMAIQFSGTGQCLTGNIAAADEYMCLQGFYEVNPAVYPLPATLTLAGALSTGATPVTPFMCIHLDDLV